MWPGWSHRYATRVLGEREQGLATAFFASLAGGQFGHIDHVRLAWLAARNSDDPLGLVRHVIEKFAAAHGADGKYHETLTGFWVWLVCHAVAARPEIDGFDRFVDAYPFLLDKKLVERHWSKGMLWSEHARHQWVAPDVLPLPA